MPAIVSLNGRHVSELTLIVYKPENLLLGPSGIETNHESASVSPPNLNLPPYVKYSELKEIQIIHLFADKVINHNPLGLPVYA